MLTTQLTTAVKHTPASLMPHALAIVAVPRQHNRQAFTSASIQFVQRSRVHAQTICRGESMPLSESALRSARATSDQVSI